VEKAIELLQDLKLDIHNLYVDRYSVALKDEAIKLVNTIIHELKSVPRWETPEQWEKRMGEKYPDRAPVWCADNDNPADPWFLDYYENAVDDERYYIICAVEGLVPPDDWRPEESPAKERPE
jgi:hypothetical protein